MDAFYGEDERILGHAADSYHRIDIHQASRNLVVCRRGRFIADTKRSVVLDESVSRRAGTLHASTSMSAHSAPWNARPSARTRDVQLLRHR
jgi:hypothetical protein